MADESVKAKVARVDERTINMEKKLDELIQAHKEHREDQGKKIENLNRFKDRAEGAGWVIGVLWAALAAALGVHVNGGSH